MSIAVIASGNNSNAVRRHVLCMYQVPILSESLANNKLQIKGDSVGLGLGGRVGGNE